MKKALVLLLAMLLVASGAHAVPGKEEGAAAHPNTVSIQNEAMLDTGDVICAKMKSLAAGEPMAFSDETSDIKAIRLAHSLPDGFVVSDANTISAEGSRNPVYIFYSNENDAGILYVYSGDCRIVMNPDSNYAFCMNTSLTDISGLSDWDTGKAVYMAGIFLNDASLASLHGLENWDTGNTVDLSGAFCNDVSLTSISALKNWDTGKIKSMSGLFMGAKKLTDVSALSGWDTSSVIGMSYMFSECISLASIDVSNWDTGNVTDMECMFQVGYSGEGNGALSEIKGLENWNVSNVTDMTCMFYGAGQMTHYDIAGWDVSNVQSFNHMFCDNFTLESLDLSAWNVQNVKTMYDMFDDARKLTTIGDVSNWKTDSLVDIGGWLNGTYAFVGDNGTLNLSGWNTESLKTAGEAFRATGLETIDLSGWTFDSIINGPWRGAGSGIYYEYGNQYSVYMGMNGMFKDSKRLSAVYVSQKGLNSYHIAENSGVNVEDMWTGTLASGFTVKSGQ